MNRAAPSQPTPTFQDLIPDTVISLVEKYTNRSLTNICRPLISYINRVYELQDLDGAGLIAKFYRPGRWSEAGLRDEHDFLLELADQEIPVIAPLVLANGDSLAPHDRMLFAVFPKKGGRSFDEYNDDQWLELGRLLGRAHTVGQAREPRDRPIMAPDKSCRHQVAYLLDHDFMPGDLKDQFQALTQGLLKEITPLFKDTEMIRIHGDCHFANLIYRPGESFFLIDFDDMVTGPPVQDFWMLLPDHVENCGLEIDLFLEGYETFRSFDHRSLKLIEPLRAMRYIHYLAWCAHQVAEDGLSRVAGADNFGSREYWQRELLDLSDQLERIRKGPVSWGNM